MNILFITWDGPQVNYLESLFIPIFKGLQDKGYKFHIIQFTWGDKNLKDFCATQSIAYKKVKIRKEFSFLGDLWSLQYGKRIIKSYSKKHNIQILMPRSIMPAYMCLDVVKERKHLKIAFDADGLALDERVDFAGWTHESKQYRFFRDVEMLSAVKAEVVITRSTKANRILLDRSGPKVPEDKFFVVSNGRDENIFKPISPKEVHAIKREIGIDANSPLLVYAGSMGDQYCLLEMLQFFSFVKLGRSDARWLILTGNKEYVLDQFKNQDQEIVKDIFIKTVSFKEIQKYLSIADLGFALRVPSFSMQAVAPIKLGEYLLSGVPVLSTKGIGDSENYLNEKKCGYLIDELDKEHLEKASEWFLKDVLPNREMYRENSRSVGAKNCSLRASIDSYVEALSYIKSL